MRSERAADWLDEEQIPDPVYAILEPYVESLQSLRAWEASARSPSSDDEETD